MSTVEVRVATKKDLDSMCKSVNMNDRDTEVMGRWFLTSTYAWSGFWQGRIACMYGVMSPSLMSDEAYIWLTTNDLVREHPFLFVRHSQLQVQKLFKEYRVIHGHVWARNPNGLQWLKWLGVKLDRQKMVNDLIPFDLERSG